MSETETESEEVSADERPSLHPKALHFIPQKTREYCVCKSTLTTNEFTIPCQSCFCRINPFYLIRIGWFHGKCVRAQPSKLFICFKCKAHSNSFTPKPIKYIFIFKCVLI